MKNFPSSCEQKEKTATNSKCKTLQRVLTHSNKEKPALSRLSSVPLWRTTVL